MVSTTDPWILPSCIAAASPMTRSLDADVFPSGAQVSLDSAATMPLPIHDRAVIEDGVDGMRCLRFEWMTRAFLHIHLNPEPRRGWNLPKALDHLDRSVHDIKIPGDGPDHFFLDHMV